MAIFNTGEHNMPLVKNKEYYINNPNTISSLYHSYATAEHIAGQLLYEYETEALALWKDIMKLKLGKETNKDRDVLTILTKLCK